MSSKQSGTTAAEGTLQSGRQVASKVHVASDSQADADITSRVRDVFANDEILFDSQINVDTSHRSVTLRGSVNSQTVAYRAIRLGRSVDGVKTVHSFLVVR